MTAEFHPEAEAEFLASVAYYNEYSPELGDAFRVAVGKAVGQVVSNPYLWPSLYRRVRRCLVHRFPYGILYGVGTGRIYVLAVMNLRRHPDYRKHRMS